MKHCSYPGCDLPYHAKGWCQMHYERVRYGGDPGVLGRVLRRHKGCNFPGCDRPHSARGWCSGHRAQRRRGRTMTPLLTSDDRKGPRPETLQKVTELRLIVGTDNPRNIAKRLGYRSPKNLARVLHRIGEHDLACRIERKKAA